VRFAKIVRRSIHLTPFGEDFCCSCLLGPDTGPDGLPVHRAPVVDRTAAEIKKDPQPPLG
jgi:hypothetical protein